MFARWMMDETIVSMSSCWIDAMSPKSRMASVFLVGSSRLCIFIRLPGCGSEWKKPTCRSCTRKHSWPTPMSSRISSLGQSDSFVPSIHSLTSTRLVDSSWYTSGTYTPLTFSWSKMRSRSLCWLEASLRKSSSV